MATKSAPAAAEPEVIDAKVEELIKIRLPRSREEDEDVYVSVNDRSWLIKRGVTVEVPACVAEVLRHQEDALEKAYEFAEAARH